MVASYNPRSHADPAHLGAILARDGTVLAQSTGGVRAYPFGPALAQTVGYASSRYGASGLESAYAEILSGAGDDTGLAERVRELLDRRSHSTVARRGRVVTAISPAIQAELWRRLSAFPRAAGVVLDPRNGDVLAMASVPSFEPTGIDGRFQTLSSDPASALLNRAADGLYPPGSTFKIVTAATALEDKVFTVESVFADPGYFAVDGFRVRNDRGEITGEQTLAGAFMLSSNVDFAQIGLKLGTKRFFDGMRAFGVGAPLRFPIEAASDRYSPEDAVSDSMLAQYAFGQADLLVSPLRMALITAAIAGGGVEFAPRLVLETVSAGGTVKDVKPAVLARPVSAATALAMQRMMVGVVTQGTGTAAAVPGIFVAGKTGTATNPHGAPHSWFVAFAPADAPRVAVAVVVENGGYGGAVAAPIVRSVIEAALTVPERTK